jgi:hypothetical protein
VDVYPNWYKVIIDTNFAPVQGVIEVPYWLIGVTDLAFPTNIPIPSGNSIGFHEGRRMWVTIADYPVKLIIERNTTDVPQEIQKPELFILYQNYPNPFNPTTTIRFSLPQRSYVTLKVFDVLGREIATLVNEELNAGEHSVVYETKGLSSGLYFCRLQMGQYAQQIKMEVIK